MCSKTLGKYHGFKDWEKKIFKEHIYKEKHLIANEDDYMVQLIHVFYLTPWPFCLY